MAISYVGGTTGTGTGASYTVSLSGTLTGGSNTSPSAGDLIVVFAGHGNTASSAPTCSGNTSGSYVGAHAALYSNDTWDANQRTFYQFAGATPDTTLTIGRTNNTTYGGATVVMVFRNVSGVTLAATATGINGAAVNPPSVTPTVAGSWVIAGGTGMTAATDTAGMTAISNLTAVLNAYGNGSTSDASTIAGYYSGWTSGAFDPAAATGGNLANASSSWAAATMVLNPLNPSLSTLTEDFQGTLDTNKWFTDEPAPSTVTFTSGEVVLNPAQSNGFGAILYSGTTNGFYDLDATGIYVKLTRRLTTANTAVGGYTNFNVYENDDQNTYVGFQVTTAGVLTAVTCNASTILNTTTISSTWDSDNTPWLKITKSGGTFTWWTASGGTTPGTWTSRATYSSMPVQFHKAKAWLQTENDDWTTTGALTGTAKFDGLNIATTPDVTLALTGQSMTASRGSMFGREINGDAPEGAFSAAQSGFWLQPKPIDRFETTTSGGTKVSAYNTSSGGANTFGLWRDRSGWGRNAVAPSSGYPYLKNSWRYTAEVFDRITVANAGGSTSAFYLAIAFAPYNYYGTMYSDMGTVGSNVGFRLSHTGDGNGTISQYIFDAGNGTSRVSVAVDAGHAVGSNPPSNTPVILEAWYDGTNLFLRKDGGTPSQSSSVTVSAGSSTAVVNAITPASATGDDVMNGGTEWYEVVSVKNALPDSTTRGNIYSYLVSRTTDPAAGTSVALVGQAATVSKGTLTPNTTVALTGQQATAARGTAGANTAVTPTGQQATSARGTLTPNTDVALVGQQATAARGTPAINSDVSIALTGQQATSARGAVTPNTTVALTGQPATSARGAVTPNTTVALTGQAATAAKGSVTVAPAAGINRLMAGAGNYLAVGAGSYLVAGTVSTDVTVALTGLLATVARGVLTPNTAVVLTGRAATVSRGSTTPGAAAVSGQPLITARGTLTPNTTVALTGAQAAVGAGAPVGVAVSAATATPNAAFGSAAFGTFAFAGDETDSYTVLNGQSMTASAGVLRRLFDGNIGGFQVGAAAGALTPVVSAAAPLPTFPGHRVGVLPGALAPSVSVQLTGLAAIMSRAGIRPRQLQPADLRSAVVAIEFTEAVVPVTDDVAAVPVDPNTITIPVAGTTGTTV